MERKRLLIVLAAVVALAIVVTAVLPAMRPTEQACSPVASPPGSLTTPFDESWPTINVTRTLVDERSPNCRPGAILVTEDTSEKVLHAITRNNGPSTATAQTYTVYAKRASGERNIEPQVFDASDNNGAYMKVDLASCRVSLPASVFGSYANPSGYVEPVGGGWCKISLTYTPIASTAQRTFVYLMNGEDDNYTGDGQSGVFVWGGDLRPAVP